MKHRSALLLLSVIRIPNATAQQVPMPSLPAVIHECDIVAAYNIRSCGEWHLDATGNYSGVWPDGSRANFTVVRFSQTEIVLKRHDVTGANASLQGEYRAKIQAGQIDGTFTISKAGLSFSGVWKGTFDGLVPSIPAAIPQQAKQGKSTDKPLDLPSQTAMIRSSSPFQITECEGRECSMSARDVVTWAFSGKNGTGVFITGNQPLTIEQMENNVIVVHRTDTVGPWLGSAVYTGRIEGTQITGTVKYFDRGHGTPRTDLWHGVIGNPATTAYAESPQQSQSAGNADPSNPSRATFSEDGCPMPLQDTQANAFELWSNGRKTQLYGFQPNTSLIALTWFCEAAIAGSGQAAFAIGSMYENGFSLPSYQDGSVIHSDGMQPDFAKAFHWFQKAADFSNTAGMLKVSQYYRFGSEIVYRAGSVVKTNPIQKDFKKSMKWLRNASSAGDTEAMNALVAIDESGIVGPSDSIPSEAISVQTQLLATGLRFEAICQGERELSIMRDLTPERKVKGASFGELHKDILNGVEGVIYSCIADLGPTQDNSMLDELAGAIQGGMMSTWTYTTYFYNKDGMILTDRAAVGEEAVKRATDFAVALAAARAAKTK